MGVGVEGAFARSARMGVLLVLLAGVLLLGGCRLWYETHRLRYIMTVEVETPQGVRSGSSVIEVQVIGNPIWDFGRVVNFGLRGEAVAIDLPDGRVLFALLRKPEKMDYAIRLPMEVFLPHFERVDGQSSPDWEARLAYLQRISASATLTREQMPVFAVFERLDDPASIRRVEIDDFPKEFGPRVRLRSVRVASTNQEPSDSMAQRLPWIPRYTRELLQLDGRRGGPRFSNEISRSLAADSLSSEGN